MVSTPRLGSPTCCAVSPIIRPSSCTSCCRGIGSNTKSLPLPPDNPPSWPWPDGCEGGQGHRNARNGGPAQNAQPEPGPEAVRQDEGKTGGRAQQRAADE